MIFLMEKYQRARSEVCTQEKLSEISGIPINIVKNIESGRKKTNPEHPEFKKMCETVGLNPNDYFKTGTKIITCLSNKGGSTKTSTASNLAYALSKKGLRILVVDTDLQKNLTITFDATIEEERNFYVAFAKNDDIRNHIRPTKYANIDIVTAHKRLSVLERETAKMNFCEQRILDITRGVKEDGTYDFIILDCNPSLNSVNVACLMATHGLIIPLIPSAFGEEGLEIMEEFYTDIKPYAPHLTIMGVLINRFDKRKRIINEIILDVKERFGKKELVFSTFIPENQAVDNSQKIKQPVATVYPNSTVAQAYDALADEVIIRAKKLKD